MMEEEYRWDKTKQEVKRKVGKVKEGFKKCTIL